MSILTVIICLFCLVLVAVVLLQKAKGGGLAAGFQSSNQIMGAPRTADFLEKTTWTIMGIIAVLCIVCTISLNYSGASDSNAVELRQNSLPALPENETPAVTEVPAADAVNE